MAARKTLKIATYNISGVVKHPPHLLAWLEKARPGIVALQEPKSDDARFPAAAREDAGMA